MATVDLHFAVLGDTLPTDHGYALYSALSAQLSAMHDDDVPIAVASIRGPYIGNGTLRLDGSSRLRLRLDAAHIPKALGLAGKSLVVSGHKVRVGVPQVRALVLAPTLVARLATIKGFTEPEPFLEAARRQLDALGISAEVEIGIPLVQRGRRAGEPCRRVMRIKTKQVVGFALQVSRLTTKESLTLQERGLGGRRRMGCGFFLATKADEP